MNGSSHTKPFSFLYTSGKWIFLLLPMSMLIGSLVAFFLWSLDWVTRTRFQYPWLLYLLPLAGVLIYFLYAAAGKNSEAGNNLILEEIHSPQDGVPARMAPLVLLSTLITHLFGGSAGREGTAVQMGGSMAAWMGRLIKLDATDLRILLTAGVAAGFGAVFGTPVTGAVFALEILVIGRFRYDALLPSLIASVIAKLTVDAWGVQHTKYPILNAFQLDLLTAAGISEIAKIVFAAVLFGGAAWLFSTALEGLKSYSVKWIPINWLLPFTGGCMIILLYWLAGTDDYLGLGVLAAHDHSVTLVSAFSQGGAGTWSWLWKLLFTVITLGMGFKGGEVTPLFFIGATLGNTLAIALGLPVELLAALGFIAVFAGATNTPLACTIMGVELFGEANILLYAITCFTAYCCSGHSSIYSSQQRLRNSPR